jgi:hypothetical protein
MNRTTLALVVLVVTASGGCVTDDVASIEQSICTIEDQEAGLCTLRSLTRDVGRAQVPPGSTPVYETWSVCSSTWCGVRIETPNLVIAVSCDKGTDGTVTCTSTSCNPTTNYCPGPIPL